MCIDTDGNYRCECTATVVGNHCKKDIQEDLIPRNQSYSCKGKCDIFHKDKIQKIAFNI